MPAPHPLLPRVPTATCGCLSPGWLSIRPSHRPPSLSLMPRERHWAWDQDHVWRHDYGFSWASKWWPGAAYVDWVGIDGYQRPRETFNSVFAKQLANIRSFTRKPVFIAETGVAPSGDQSSQIAGLF